MTGAPIDEARLVAYLLGQAGSDEQAEIEARYMSDPDFLAELEAVERDLIDRYVRDEVEDRATVEAHFLASPSRRAKVAFARALLESSRPKAAPAVRSRSVRWMLAAAAVAVVAIGAGLLVMRGRDVAPEIPATVSTPSPAAPAPAPPVAPPTAAPPVRFATLILTPTLTRDGGGLPATIEVGNADEARLQLAIESADFTSYAVRVRTADGVDIWTQAGLTAESRDGGWFVIASVPASRLPPDDYIVTVNGLTSAGQTVEIAGYSFRAQR